jgi:predicted acylesterase/phospholipase RssA
VLRLILFIAGLSVWQKLLFEKRGHICDWAYASTLFNRNGTITRLHEIEKEINHVFCATDLHAGEHVYFAGDFVYSYRFGLGKPGDLLLSTAVEVSAAFPGGFPPRWLATDRHQFQGGEQSAEKMVLSDGGVYDNMGEQWAVGLQRRKQRVAAPQFKDIDELVVVNSSSTVSWHPLGSLRIPILGELFALLEVVNTLYDNTTSPRRTTLIEHFDAASKSKSGMTGVLITIDQTPFNVAKFFENSTEEPERSARSKHVLDALSGHSEQDWKAAAKASGAVATTLRKLGRKASSRLIYHAYVVANCNCHIILEYPLLPIPDAVEFEKRIFG